MTLEPINSDLGRWVSILVPAAQLAERIAGTSFVPKAMRGKPDVVTAAIMYGDELGLGPMQALSSIYEVEGRPFLSSELQRALVLREGHAFTVHESTGLRCRVSGLRKGRPEAERVYVEWTIDQAKAAGLLSKSNWRSYPRSMLVARAFADLCRILFPDVIKGLGQVPDNMAPDDAWGPDTDAEPPPVAPPAKAVPQRRRKPSLPSPGHTLATEDKPGPDGSVDVPLPDDADERGTTAPPIIGGPSLPAPDAPPGDRRRVDNPPVVHHEAERGPRERNPNPHSEEPTPPPEAVLDEEPAEDAPPKAFGERPAKALQAALTEALGRAPRDDRLGAVSAIIGRPLDSSANLTRDEGYRALGFLQRVNAGTAGLVKRNGEWQAVVYDPADSERDPWRPEPDNDQPLWGSDET